MNIEQFKAHWRDWLMLLFGVWLVISPFALGYGATDAMMVLWNPVIVGVAVVVFAIAVLRKTQVWEEWVLLALGAWLMAAPFLLGYATMPAAMWNSIIVGLLVGADSVWSLVVMLGRSGHKTA
uniref:SPW repeat protein n=1 Tax=Marinobacterium profundum TaxID=1714300 RepID=UPI00082DCE7A|nr:SPW repeat protein [Marinobacterium profundum]